jgi:hypothetical protein
MTRRKIQYWVIPPKADSEFVACMENVLDTYALPFDPTFPVICMDEQPVQLLKETRVPVPATKTHARRVDYEYERNGTASIFLFTEPLAGWRQVSVRERRTKIDWAIEMEELLCNRYATAEKVILVCDNLNTHTMGAFYEAFSAPRAHSLVRRLEFRYTPKHGSWLNIAESEISALVRTGLPDRVDSLTQFRRCLRAVVKRRNQSKAATDWQFTNQKARIKLKTLYPSTLS